MLNNIEKRSFNENNKEQMSAQYCLKERLNFVCFLQQEFGSIEIALWNSKRNTSFPIFF